MAAHNEAELEGWLRMLVRHGLHVHNTPSGQYSRFYLVGWGWGAVWGGVWRDGGLEGWR